MDVLVPLFEQETGYDLKPIYTVQARQWHWALP